MTAAIQTLDSFARLSNLKVNRSKTRAIWIGCKKLSGETFNHMLKLNCTQTNFDILGIKFSCNLDTMVKINFKDKIEQIDKDIVPMGTNCAPLVADLFLFCYERDFMLSLSDNNQADIIEAFNSTSRYLDDLLNIDNPYFEQMVGQIYPTELQLNKANSSDTEAPFLDLNLSITNGIVSSKIYDKRDDINFEIVNFPFLDGDVPRSPSYGVYIFSLFVLLECALMLMTSTTETYF